MKVNQAPVGIADANADLNWVVGVTAQRIVPGPPTFLQLSAGASVLLAWLGRRQMRGRRVRGGAPTDQEMVCNRLEGLKRAH